MIKDTRLAMSYYRRGVRFSQQPEVRRTKTEFGLAAMAVIDALYELITIDWGYFMVWDDETALDIADDLGCAANFVNEVLQGCLRRSLFDAKVFEMFNVLTSKSIQENCIIANKDAARKASINKPYILDGDILLIPPEDIKAEKWDGVFRICTEKGISKKYESVSWKLERNSKKIEQISVQKETQTDEIKVEDIHNSVCHFGQPYKDEGCISINCKKRFKLCTLPNKEDYFKKPSSEQNSKNEEIEAIEKKLREDAEAKLNGEVVTS